MYYLVAQVTKDSFVYPKIIKNNGYPVGEIVVTALNAMTMKMAIKEVIDKKYIVKDKDGGFWFSQYSMELFCCGVTNLIGKDVA